MVCVGEGALNRVEMAPTERQQVGDFDVARRDAQKLTWRAVSQMLSAKSTSLVTTMRFSRSA